MTGFKTVSLADQVFEKLENDIITGVYPRGEILTELKLVEALGVSRTPIREALRRLEQERLIAESGKGSVVLGITQDDLLDIMDIRQRVEGLAAFHAAQRITPEGTEKLRGITQLQEFYFQKQDVENLRKIDDQFHDTIYELTGSTVLYDTLLPLHRKTQRFRKISIQDSSRVCRSVQEHHAIFEAIAVGNAALAEKLMEEHIANAKNSMIERLKDHG